MKRPGKPARRGVALDRRITGAVATIFEAVDVLGRQRALWLIEAIAALIAVAPRRVPRSRR